MSEEIEILEDVSAGVDRLQRSELILSGLALVELELDTGLQVDGDDAVRALGQVMIQDLLSDIEEVQFVVAKRDVDVQGEVLFVFEQEFLVQIQGLDLG